MDMLVPAAQFRRLQAVYWQSDPLLQHYTYSPVRAVATTGGTTAQQAAPSARVAKGVQFLEALVAAGTTSGACLAVSRHAGQPAVYAIGHSGPTTSLRITGGLRGSMQLRSDSIFMTASITKPFTAAAVMLLVQEGRLTLDDYVADHLSGFAEDDVQVHHLLSHTSGLPDSWSGNHPLRKRHASLVDYFHEQLSVNLLFRPGTNVSYSSVAIDLAGAIVEKISGQTLSEFLHQRFFLPLGMPDTSLGHPPGAQWSRKKTREVCLNLRPGRHNRAGRTVGDPYELPLGSLSFGNSDYWRELGCPSGGLSTTALDLLRFMEAFLLCKSHGTARQGFPLSPETVALMTQSHTGNATAAAERAGVEILDDGSWGLGWRINSEGSTRVFGIQSQSSQTFGAHGSSGCMVWADPESGMVCVVLTPEPDLCYSTEFNVLSDLLGSAR